MQSRRGFLKLLLGMGAFLLPWTTWPGKFNQFIKANSIEPEVKLYKYMSEPLAEELKVSLKKTALDDIYALSDPIMEGRRAGSAGEERASQYLTKELSALGLKPLGDHEDSFAHFFTIPSVQEKFIGGRLTFASGTQANLRPRSINILGSLKGEAEDKVILLSAHYDHMGIHKGKVYPGANDNASGVGCVLEVLRRLIKEKEVPKLSIVIAFWSGEEMGFVGSRAFVDSPTFPLKSIQAVINVDTIGNGSVGDYALWSDSEASIAVKTIKSAAAEAGASDAVLVPGNGHNSDQVSFTSVGIPAVTMMARQWLEGNHAPVDTVENIDVEQVELACEIVYRAVRKLAFG